MWNDADGADWRPDNQNDIAAFQIGSGILDPADKIIALQGLDVNNGEPGLPLPGDTIHGIDRRKCAPSIAVDRSVSPNDVYVAFYARRTRGDTSAPDRNTDIYVARGRKNNEPGANGRIDFPAGGPAANETLQLTDEMLGVPAISGSEPDQIMPAIAVDWCGNVHVVFYDTRKPDNLPLANTNPNHVHWVDVYYVRIVGFGTSSSPTIVQKRVSPTSFQVSEQGAMLGDYHTLAEAGGTPKRTLYTAYIASAGATWTDRICFLHKITIAAPCAGDFNLNGISDGEDVTLFTDALLTEDPLADLDENSVIEYQDVSLFLASFGGGG